jgi:ubiquinone/menaquinone biosynthesis C-methylase UbiE
MNDIYGRKPLSYFGDIPCFSEDTEYIENYDKISSDHLRYLNAPGENPFMDDHYWKDIEESTISILLKHVTNEKIILDVGVGMGRLLSYLPPEFEKYGVDISTEYLKIANTKGITVCKSLIEDLPYKDDFFEIITCTDVLEHVLDLNAAVKEILRVTKPNGLIIIRVPYKESLKSYVNCQYKFVHLRNFDEYSLKLFFEKIMQTKVLDYKTAGGDITREKLRAELPNIVKVGFFIFIQCSYFINKKTWRVLANYFFPHAEINMVVKKCAI